MKVVDIAKIFESNFSFRFRDVWDMEKLMSRENPEFKKLISSQNFDSRRDREEWIKRYIIENVTNYNFIGNELNINKLDRNVLANLEVVGIRAEENMLVVIVQYEGRKYCE